MLLSRREMIIDGLRVAVVLPFFPSLVGAGVRSRERGERVLVIVQLTGGNDGLNTLVPHRQDEYYRLRPTIGLERNRLHPLDEDHGLHPELGALAGLYKAGHLACVHGIGYPNPDRSHFRSMEVWHNATPPENEPAFARGVGWLGALADQLAERDLGTLPAIHVGDGDLPLALRGERVFAPSVASAESFRLHEASSRISVARAKLLEDKGSQGELGFLRGAARASYAAAERIEALASKQSGIDYPGGAFGSRLELVARLITGGFGARIFHVSLGGFDTHVRQAQSHAELMGEFSRGLHAFQADLEDSGTEADVVTFAFSEFGRRVAENGSRGTDHGAGGPAFLMGSSVAGGMHGTAPDLSKLQEGDVPFTTDFRAVYTTLERDWMGLRPSTEIAGLPLFS